MVNIQSMQKSYMDEQLLSWAAIVAAETNTSVYNVLDTLYTSMLEVAAED